jgi:cell division protein FtsW
MERQENSVLRYLHGDKIIWATVGLLFLCSMLAVHSATGSLAFKEHDGNTAYYLLKQIGMSVFGILLIYVCHLIDYRYYSRIAQLLWFVSIPLLIYTMYFGIELNSANRWLTLPVLGLTIQTSDLAKLALIMFLARQLSIKQDQIKDFKQAFLPLLFPIIISCALIAPENLSTALLLFVTSVFILFLGRVSLKHIGGLFGLSIVSAALFIVLLFTLPESMLINRMLTWKNRIENFIHPQEDPDADYQVVQAKIAIAKGGLFRLSPGGSDQRNFLPHPYSDFIYAIIIEEYGLAGGVVLLLFYLLVLFRCLRIVISAPKAFGALLALGLGMALVLQALIHMGVSVSILPVTGVTLPLMSMGGSSVVFTSIAFGIILSVSRDRDLEISSQNHAVS